MEQQEVITLSPQQAVLEGAKNLISYGRIFMPKTFRQDSPAFHSEIGAALYSSERQVAIEVFRDGAKTTLLRTFISQRIAYAISRTILVVSASQGHSILTLRWIKRQVEFNTKWAQTFQLSPGSKWSDEMIEIKHGIEHCTITLMAVGITGQLRGFNIDDYRPDLIVSDDSSTDEMTNTMEQRKKYEDLFFGALINSLAPRSESPLAKVVLLDTPKNKFDLIESCAERSDWKFVRFGILDEKGESRWPSRYPTDEVLRAKAAHIEAGLIELWMREKECKVIASELASFKSDNLSYYDVTPPFTAVVISIDPASSDSKTADDQVIMAVGFRGPDVYVLEYSAHKGEMPDEACRVLFEMIRKYRPQAVTSESVSYQRVLAWYIEREMRSRRIFVPVDRIDDRRNKFDRIVQAIGSYSAYGKLHVRSNMSELITQYTEFSPRYKGHDDILDALAQAIHWSETKNIASFIDGEYDVLDEDENVPQLEFRTCP